MALYQMLYIIIIIITSDRPMLACFAVEWILKHVLEKKNLSVTYQEKNCLF